jgi:hypothetical protein
VDLCGGMTTSILEGEGQDTDAEMAPVTRKFDIPAKRVGWLGFFRECRMIWQAHVKHRLTLEHYHLRTVARVVNANAIPPKLARKVAWSVTMSTVADGIEAIWEGQQWLL